MFSDEAFLIRPEVQRLKWYFLKTKKCNENDEYTGDDWKMILEWYRDNLHKISAYDDI